MEDKAQIPTVILAAGRSSRMGARDKLLEDIDGLPLLRRQVERALESGLVIVTLPSADHPRAAVVPARATIVVVAGQMSDSIRAGIAAVPVDAPGVVILPADMPDITAADISAVKAAATDDIAIVRAATQDGKPGHPIYFARKTFSDFNTIEGDRGAFRICENWPDDTKIVPLNGQRARLDLDTPEDWDRYRNRSRP